MADANRHLSLQVGLTLHNVYRVAVADRLVGLYNTPPKLRAVWLIISPCIHQLFGSTAHFQVCKVFSDTPAAAFTMFTVYTEATALSRRSVKLN